MKTIAALSAIGVMSIIPLATTPAQAQFSINLSANFAPPALPIYDQPPIPGPDYIWAPGYWAWDDYVQDYYWIPGTWVMAPHPGLLWTPAWWGWQDGVYLFHAGYWGPHVGFYGGVNYGFGYTGLGYQGAYWSGPHVFYNRSVTNITNVNVTNVYNKTVIVNRVTNVSYNGGPGGVLARPSTAEQQAMREPHVMPTAMQQQHFQAARANRQLFASSNHGRPPIAAAPRPGQLGGPGVMATRQALSYHPPENRPMPSGTNPHNPSAGLPPHEQPAETTAVPADTVERSAVPERTERPVGNRLTDGSGRDQSEYVRPPAPPADGPMPPMEMRRQPPPPPHTAVAPRPAAPPRMPAPPREPPKQPPHPHPQGEGHPKPQPHEHSHHEG